VDDPSLSARARLINTRRGAWVDERLFSEARQECLDILQRVARELEASGIVEMLRGERKHLGDTALGERISQRENAYSGFGWWYGSRDFNREAMELLVERVREYELPEEHEAYLLARRAREHVDTCGACGRSLLPGEPVHFGTEVYVGFPPIRWWRWAYSPLVCQPRYQRTVLCGSCAPEWLSPNKGSVVAQLCARCERPMVYRLTAATMRRTFCTEACGRAYHDRLRNQRRKERGAVEREKACEVCGKGFTATRKDARTCSPSCKQKAYRQRQREARQDRR
jgi:predicted nucleic acid-binding Zn ribbon protein